MRKPSRLTSCYHSKNHRKGNCGPAFGRSFLLIYTFFSFVTFAAYSHLSRLRRLVPKGQTSVPSAGNSQIEQNEFPAPHMHNKQIKSALLSVFYKDGLEPIVKKLHQLGVAIYSTGGTQQFIESLGLPCVAVESLTSYPSILGGRVKTLHPSVFGGILGRRDQPTDMEEMARYHIPEMDLVIVDLYPFEETVASTKEDKAIIEKIDVGGPSMIRGAAKNHKDVVVVGSKADYAYLESLLDQQKGETTLEQRRALAAKAFEVCAHYDVAIARYFVPAGSESDYFLESMPSPKAMRYGENPHQSARFYGRLESIFDQLNGKE